MLSAYQFETEVASDGFEAGLKVMEFNPGLIILDLFMPGMDGFEVCKRIKGNPETSHIKILAITGFDTKENRNRIMAAGADAYMTKPFNLNTLLEGINETKCFSCRDDAIAGGIVEIEGRSVEGNKYEQTV